MLEISCLAEIPNGKHVAMHPCVHGGRTKHTEYVHVCNKNNIIIHTGLLYGFIMIMDGKIIR